MHLFALNFAPFEYMKRNFLLNKNADVHAAVAIPPELLSPAEACF
jgi:hypothetical protein